MGGGQGQNITHAWFMTDLACTVHQYTSEQVQCKGWQPELKDKVWQQKLLKSLPIFGEFFG